MPSVSTRYVVTVCINICWLCFLVLTASNIPFLSAVTNRKLFRYRTLHDQWDTFTFTVVSDVGVSSFPGTVTLVPPTGAIVGSGFLLDGEGWTVEGNKALSSLAAYEPYSRGALLNHYILGADDKINVRAAGAPDQSLWYFVAPPAFLGNVGISYGGAIQFTLSSFAGDFSKLNSDSVSILYIDAYCSCEHFRVIV